MSALVQTGAAVAPVVVVLALLALRAPSLLAGTVGLATAVVAAAVVFRPDDDEVLASLAQLGPTVLEVALILLGGVLLATALSATGSRDHIAGWLERICSDWSWSRGAPSAPAPSWPRNSAVRTSRNAATGRPF